MIVHPFLILTLMISNNYTFFVLVTAIFVAIGSDANCIFDFVLNPVDRGVQSGLQALDSFARTSNRVGFDLAGSGTRPYGLIGESGE